MAILDILLYPDERLRQVAEPVPEINDSVRQLLDDMAETMYRAPGIGLAATQVGRNLRVITVDVGPDDDDGSPGVLYQLVNPEIVHEAGRVESEEGCLSLPDIRDRVRRSAEIVVNARDRDGKPVTIEASGLLAICLQHEIDHLNGVLFIDHISKLKRDMVVRKFTKLAKQRVTA
ncbi:MAG: peptide deformylase [Bdellovibrionales bacterium]|nr:peptide deformylase [Bdellovibrionales bacterium]